jgi:ribonuclease III
VLTETQHQVTNNMETPTLPYNPSNVLLQTHDISSLLTKYEVVESIADINIYRKAFVHRSYCTRKNENFVNGNTQCPENCIPLQEESNERLEFLGDAIINLIIAQYLYRRYSDENEGFLTKLRTKLVNGVTLSEFARTLQLGRFVLLSKQIEENEGRNNRKILEDCFESFIGAMFLDFQDSGRSGFDLCSTWLIAFIEDNIDFASLVAINHNHKDTFLKFYQHKHNEVPRFFEISTENVVNGKLFTVCIKTKKGALLGTGTGMSKKEAENDASKKALEYFGHHV